MKKPLPSMSTDDGLQTIELNNLSSEEYQNVCKQLKINNLDILQQLKKTLQKKRSIGDFEPFEEIFSNGDDENGKQLIHEGKVGCIIIAGGQGTRLRFNGPKGMFPLNNQSLFEIFAEKVRQAGKELPVAIMTSPLNHEEILNFFEKNNFFGLDRSQISFFSQGMLPLLNQEGNLFLEAPEKIALGPDGNGYTLANFYQSGLWKKWVDLGVRYLNVVPIDNPLANPFDPKLVSFHHQHQNDVTMKCILREDPDEKVGVVVKNQDRVTVVEYSEISDEERLATLSDGSLKHKCANISLFCFSMSFVEKIAKETLPLHAAFKAVNYLTSNGKSELSKEPIAWKFETFIFDLLPFAQKVGALIYDRNVCFAPLKTLEGPHGVEAVEKALRSS